MGSHQTGSSSPPMPRVEGRRLCILAINKQSNKKNERKNNSPKAYLQTSLAKPRSAKSNLSLNFSTDLSETAFLQLAALVGSMIQFGEKADIVLTDTKTFLETSLEQFGDVTRLTGSASQALKALREKEYLQKTYQAFKSFVGMKKANLTLEEQKEE